MQMGIIETRKDRSASEIQNPGVRACHFQQSIIVSDLDEPALGNGKGRRGWPTWIHREHVRVMHDQLWVAIVDASDHRQAEQNENQHPSSQPSKMRTQAALLEMGRSMEWGFTRFLFRWWRSIVDHTTACSEMISGQIKIA
jgi:hypothetical protein